MSGPLKKLDEVAYLCGESGVFHSDNAMMFYNNTKSFTPININNTYSEYFEKLHALFLKSKIDIKYEFQSHFFGSNQEIISFIDEFSAKIDELHDKKALIEVKLNKLPKILENKKIEDVNLKDKYNITILSIKRKNKIITKIKRGAKFYNVWKYCKN